MTNNTTFQIQMVTRNNSVMGHVPGPGTLGADFFMTGGVFTANGVSAVTVTEPTVTANSVIILTLKTVGGTVGVQPHVATVTPGTGFTVVCTATDTSVYNYLVVG